MIGKVAQRREQRTAEIVACAWDLARVHGIAGLTLHALAREVGIRQPSLYEYFDSKHALYDAMFADGNRQLIDRLDEVDLPLEPRAALKSFMRAFVDFAVADMPRCALLFERTIPGFEPSPESYELAEEALRRANAVLRAAGIETQDDIDCFVAMVGGLIQAQVSNDPGGDRWIRHLDRLTNMHVDAATQRTQERTSHR